MPSIGEHCHKYGKMMKCRIKNAQFNWTNPFGKMSKWHLEETQGMMRLIHNMACVTMINHSSNLAVTNGIYTCRCRCRTVYHIHEFICSIYYLMIIKYQTRRQNMQKWSSTTPRGKFQFSNKYLEKVGLQLGRTRLEIGIFCQFTQAANQFVWVQNSADIFSLFEYNISTLFVTYRHFCTKFRNLFRVFP